MTDDSKTAGGISVHAVDVARGIPAAGLSVRLRRIEPDVREIAEGACADDGHFIHPVSKGTGVTRGLYEIRFGVAEFYRHGGVSLPNPAFITDAVFEFGIDHVTEHFHLPFKFTPWGFSLFRGGS